MKSAYCVFLSSTQNRLYFYLAVALLRSIRRFDPVRDIVVLVPGIGLVSADDRDHLTREGALVRDTKALIGFGNRRDVMKYDLSKIQAWSLVEYEKVLFFDADCILTRDVSQLFDLPELTAQPGPFSPLNSSRLVLRPSLDTLSEMYELIAAPGFDEERGWRGAGPFPHWTEPGRISRWDFNGAGYSQGFLYYFFNNRKHCLSYHGFPGIGHLGGGLRRKLEGLESGCEQHYMSFGVWNELLVHARACAGTE